MIRATTTRLARADGLTPSVRHTLSGEVPRMLGLRDFLVDANEKAGLSTDQAAQRLQARLEKRVEQLVQRESSSGHAQRQRRRPQTAGPSRSRSGNSQRPMSAHIAARSGKPQWSPTATRASANEYLGQSAKTKPSPQGGGSRTVRPAAASSRSRAATRRSRAQPSPSGSRSLQLAPMDSTADEMAQWERTLQEQRSRGESGGGGGVFGVWSDDFTDGVAAWSRGSSTVDSTPDSPPLSPSLLVQKKKGGTNEMDAAVLELAEAMRPEWGKVVVALREAAAAAGSVELSAGDIVRVLQSTPAVRAACDPAMISSVVYHVEAQLKADGKARESMGYIGLLHRLMSVLQPAKGRGGAGGTQRTKSLDVPAARQQSKEDAAVQEYLQEDEKKSNSPVVSPAPWNTKKVEAVATPKSQTNNYDEKTEIKLHAGAKPQPFDRRMTRRRVMEKIRGGSLKQSFKDMDLNGNGTLCRSELRDALWKLDIDMDDDEFEEMFTAIDTDNSREIDFSEFKKYMMSGQGERTGMAAPMGVIENMSMEQCTALIQDKVRGRLRGGPAELRRTFQFFDTNGSGAIDRDEFIAGLRQRCGIQFAPPLMGKLWLHLTNGGGGLATLDYRAFCRAVMCSLEDDDTTFNSSSRSLSSTTANDMGNTEQFIRRKVREHWKDLCRDFNFATMNDPVGDGAVTPETLRSILYRYNIILQEEVFASLVLELDDDHDGRVSHQEFLSHFGNGTPQDRQVSAVVTLQAGQAGGAGAVSTPGAGGAAVEPGDIRQAHRMIQDVVQSRIKSGPAELRRAFQFFDRSGDGKIDHQEWCYVLERFLGLPFEQPLCDALFEKFAKKREEQTAVAGGPSAAQRTDMWVQNPHRQQQQKKQQQQQQQQQQQEEQTPKMYIDYHSFCQYLMESKSSGGNSGTGLSLSTRHRAGGSKARSGSFS